jgi:ABC-type branched-subunit amino acid transport system substrate-binding protein
MRIPQQRCVQAAGWPIRLLALFPIVCTVPAGAGTLDTDQAAGRALFISGLGAAGPVVAAVGAGQVAVPASSIPCASCHGRDGRGQPEGGVRPPDITWKTLSAPAVRPGSGDRPGYNLPAIVRAVTLGLDVQGRPLDPVMPRYRLRADDAAHLVSYLMTLGTRPDPGVAADRLTLGTVLPRPDAPSGALLHAAIDRLNADGGLLGRQVDLAIAPQAATPAEAVRQLLETRPVFALVAPWIAHDEPAVARYAEAEGVPMVGAETLFPDAAGPSPHGLFFLDGGVPAEVRVLALAAAALDAVPTAVVDRADLPDGEAVAQFFDRGGTPLRRTLRTGDTADTLVRDLSQAGIRRLLWLAPGFDGFAAAAAGAGYRPTVLAPAEFAAGLPSPILALRAGPGDQSAEALAAYRDLARTYHLPDTDRAAQIRALVAIRLLVDALERAGRDLTRESLVRALEATRDFRSGLIPPLSYGPGRRIGSTGAWIVRPGTAPEWLD